MAEISGLGLLGVALLGGMAFWGAGVLLEPDAPSASPEVAAAQKAATDQAERDKVQAEWNQYVDHYRGVTISWCEPSTGNRLYWVKGNASGMVSPNDDSCPQPAPQLVYPGKPA